MHGNEPGFQPPAWGTWMEFMFLVWAVFKSNERMSWCLSSSPGSASNPSFLLMGTVGAVAMIQVLGSLLPTQETRMELWAPSFCLAWPGFVCI